MATEHDGRPEPATPFETTLHWRAGAVGGFLAALVMGVAITAVQLDTLRVAIAGLYGFAGSLLVGWAAHLFHGTLFGLLFAWVLSDPGFYRVSERRPTTLLAAVVYAVVLAVAGAGIVMPIWLDMVGLPTPSSIPHVTLPLLVWHLVYGVVLGLVYPPAERRTGERTGPGATG